MKSKYLYCLDNKIKMINCINNSYYCYKKCEIYNYILKNDCAIYGFLPNDYILDYGFFFIDN